MKKNKNRIHTEKYNIFFIIIPLFTIITFMIHPKATKDSKIMKIYWRHIKYYSSIYNYLAFHKNE